VTESTPGQKRELATLLAAIEKQSGQGLKREWATPINRAAMEKQSMLFCDARLVWIPFALFACAVFCPGTTSLWFLAAAGGSYGLLRWQFARWPWLLDDLSDHLAFADSMEDVE
jgi:hypothetical protein